jgi:hypothetical protein
LLAPPIDLDAEVLTHAAGGGVIRDDPNGVLGTFVRRTGRGAGYPADCGRASGGDVTDQHAWSSAWANTRGAVMHTE